MTGKRKWTPKKICRLAVIILALAAMIAAACYTLFIAPALEQPRYIYKPVTVERGNVTLGITESGSLSLGTQSILYDLDIDTATDDEDEDDDEDENSKYLEVEAVFVAPGQRIDKGDPVMSFTQDSIEDIRKLLTTALTDAEIALSEANTDYSTGALSAQSAYDETMQVMNDAETVFNAGMVILQNTISEKAQQIAVLNEEIDDLIADQKTASDAVGDARYIYEHFLEEYQEELDENNCLKDVTLQTEYMQAQKDYDSAVSRYDQVLSQLQEKQEKITKLQEEATAANNKLQLDTLSDTQTLQSAQSAGQIAMQVYNMTLASLKETVDEAQADVDEAARQLEAFNTFVGDGIILSDGSGIVTEVGYEAEDTLEMAGTIVAYAPENQMSISVDVSEEDIVALSLGDPVEIAFSAYPDASYQGTITSITTTKASDHATTISYPVVIQVSGDTGALYGGMTADVTFVTEEVTDCLYISKQAIVTQNGNDYVYILDSNQEYVLQKIETGITDSINTQVISGLSEGDTVYIRSVVNGGDYDK